MRAILRSGCAGSAAPGIALLAALLHPQAAASSEQPVTPWREVARAGAVAIDARDIQTRAAMLRARGVPDAEPAQALTELVSEALEAEVARAERLAPTATELAALDRHASDTSRAPAVLEAIHAVFGADRARYERQVLAPPITNAKLRAHFARSAAEHAAARRAIEDAWARVAGGASFTDAATAVGGERRTWRVSSKVETPAVMVEAGAAFAEDPLVAIARGLADGALYDRIIEDDERLLVLRRLREEDGAGIAIEAIVIAKRRFEDWYREGAEAIPLDIRDPQLRAATCATYGSAWFLARACPSNAAR